MSTDILGVEDHRRSKAVGRFKASMRLAGWVDIKNNLVVIS